MSADYNDVISRLMNENMVKKFALKFLNDDNFSTLGEAIERGDGETAFRAAHTLKGICLNLGFSKLYEASYALTEKLRGRSTEGCEELYKAVCEQYENTCNAIKQVD